MPDNLETGLYIHIPWCVKKCPYCDFNSHAQKDDLPEAAYIAALLANLQQDIARVGRREIGSIFIGGGTPSLFSATSIAQLLAGVKNLLPCSDTLEVTLEANPGTFEQARFCGFRKAGVNRLSIGIQSFSDSQLNALGRIHSSDEATRAITIARQAGFDNINLDVMYGLPKQLVTEALADLQQAIDLHPTHLSWYQLTLEPNTLFHAKPPPLPIDDVTWTMQQQGQRLLAEHGYQQYEISAYAREGKTCWHNKNYWLFGDYYGIGAGAHSKLTLDDGIYRGWRYKQPKAYLQAAQDGHDCLGGWSRITATELPFEFMLNALRLEQWIGFAQFEKMTGVSRACLQEILTQAVDKDLLCVDTAGLQKTPLGKRFLDDLTALFLICES